MNTKLFLILVTAMFFTSCEEILIGPAVSNDPISNFEEMWKSYDQYYGLFEVKEVDWQATYNQYRPQINEQTTDDQLKTIFHEMIDPLDDNHTFIITTENEPRIESGIFDTLKVQTDFSLDLIPSYVSDFTHYGTAIDYGMLADNIGYIHLGDFIPSRKYFEEALDQIIGKLKDTDGLVIDIRDNPGGNDVAAQYVAGRFAAERKLYMNVRKKSGPGPNDFTHYGAAIDYGTLAGNLGYIHLGDFIPSRKYFEDALDQIIAKLKDTDGLVIDIRDNPGGNDVAAQYVAGRFAAERKLYMNVRKKSGPGPNDFTQAIPWHVEPTGGTRYTKPIVLLTSRWTQSAGETFTLAMQELTNVTQLGDFTSGAFSDNIARELPNGWFCFMSIGDYRAADGESYEGIGVKPDLWLVNSKQDILSGKDRTLEKALELL